MNTHQPGQTSTRPSASELDAPDSFASLPHLERARAWVGAAEGADSDDRRAESLAEAAHAFAEAGDVEATTRCLDGLLAMSDPRVRSAQRGVDAATMVGDMGRALRLYTFVLPSISLDEKRAATAFSLADEAAKLADRPLERFFLREVMAVHRSEEYLARFAQSVVLSGREGEALDDDDRSHAVLSLVHLARRHRGEQGFSYAASALELDPRNDDALELFVDRGAEAGHHETVRVQLEGARAVLGGERQAVALGRLAASLDDRPTGTLPSATTSSSAIVDLDDLDDEPLPNVDPRIAALLAEAATLKSFPSLHVTKLREILVLDPLEGSALAELRTILTGRGDHEGLRDVLVEASDAAKARRWPVAKRLPIVRELAELCAGPLDDAIGAIDALEELVRSDAKNAEARTALRGHLERVGRWDAVAKLLEEGLASAAVPADVLGELAKLHLEKRRDTAAAAEALGRRARMLGSDLAAWREALQLTRALRDRAKLEASLVEALGAIGAALTTTERATLHEELAGLRKASGDLAGAEKLFSDAALATRDARLFAAAEACAAELGAAERAARAALAQADLADEGARAAHLVRAALHFSEAGARKLALATLRDAVGAGATPEVVKPVIDRAAREEAAETFDWVATIALRATRDRAGWLALAESLLGGQAAAPRAIPLVKELLRQGATAARLKLLGPLPWATDDELRALVEAVAERVDAGQELRTEAALLCAHASRVRGDRDSALRVLRALPHPLDARVVAELLELGTGVLGAQEELELVEQALATTSADSDARTPWLERAMALAHARHDARRELRYALELLSLDGDDFDRLARATALAREVDDVGTLDRCLARAIEAEADDDGLADLVRERARLLADRLSRVDDALALAAEHAVQSPALRVFWVELAMKCGRHEGAAATIECFESLSPAEAVVDTWLEALPSNDGWLALARAACRKAAAPSRRALALAASRGHAAHARELFAVVGPAPSGLEAVAEAKALQTLGLTVEAFASVRAHVDLPATERPAEVVALALTLAPSAREAAIMLTQVRDLSREAFHDALLDVLGRVEADAEAVGPVLRAVAGHVDGGLLAARTGDARVLATLVAMARDLQPSSLPALVAACKRVGVASEVLVEARAHALAQLSGAHDDAAIAGVARDERLAALARACELCREEHFAPLAAAWTEGLREAGRLEEALAVATKLAERHGAYRELLEAVLEQAGRTTDLVASLEKRWSLEKDAARRLTLARRIADVLERSDADPREVADAWRRVLRLEPKDAHATAALERAKARALGARVSTPAPVAVETPAPLVAAAGAVTMAAETTTTTTLEVEAPAPLASEPTALEDLSGEFATTSAVELAEVDAAAASMTSAIDAGEADDVAEVPDDAIASLTGESESLEAASVDDDVIPEALASSELLDDSALESIPDAGELA